MTFITTVGLEPASSTVPSSSRAVAHQELLSEAGQIVAAMQQHHRPTGDGSHCFACFKTWPCPSINTANVFGALVDLMREPTDTNITEPKRLASDATAPTLTGRPTFALEAEGDALPDFVASLPPGTRFIDTDPSGRRTPMMTSFQGRVVADNGSQSRPFGYGDTEGYSIRVTHVSVQVDQLAQADWEYGVTQAGKTPLATRTFTSLVEADVVRVHCEQITEGLSWQTLRRRAASDWEPVPIAEQVPLLGA